MGQMPLCDGLLKLIVTDENAHKTNLSLEPFKLVFHVAKR